MKIRIVGSVMHRYIGGTLKIGPSGTPEEITAVEMKDVGRGDADAVITCGNKVHRFNYYLQGILVDSGAFVGEDDKFAFMLPAS